MPFRAGGAAILCLVVLTVVRPLQAQVPLFLVDEATTVRSVSFRFDSTKTFEAGTLQDQIATTGPGFFDRVKRVLPFMTPAPHPFSPLELQRDVARLRLFYRENGFLRARIGYAPSRLDTTRNRIRVVFTIHEGPPLLVRSVVLGLQVGSLVGPEEAQWQAFQQKLALKAGDRYSEFERVQTRGQVLAWLQDHGHAFGQVRDTVVIDSTALTADLRFTVDPGPLTYFGDIEVEGNTSVGPRVIVRELPFRPGQRYTGGKLLQGQREVFALNLFRTALVDLPAQPRDSTVRVLVRVREARPQLLTYRAGYDREAGLLFEGDHTHRNFFGGARTLTTSLILNTGYGAVPAGDRPAARLFRVAVALRQPYLFVTQFSGSVAPFLQYERDQLLEDSSRPLGVNVREYGLQTTLLYEVLPFRTVSLQHVFSQATLFIETNPTTGAAADRFDRSILTLSGTFGRSDNYLNPARGVLVRPALEVAGRVLGSDVQYYKAATEVTAYTPLTRRTGVAGRIFAGRLWPFGKSRAQEHPLVENRFDPIRFYAGGGSDLRGWGEGLAGPKVPRLSVVDGDTLGYVYEAVGGLAKLAANVELRLPFPGLGPDWGTGVFFGAGRLSEGDLGLDGFRYGTGAGLRYRTPVGFLRLDLAYKLNPDPEDLRPADAFARQREAADPDWLRRFNVHLSIGQAF